MTVGAGEGYAGSSVRDRRSAEAKPVNGLVSHRGLCALLPSFTLLCPLLLQQRAQPIPWVLDQGSCWGPRQAKPPLSPAERWQKPFCSYCMNNWVGMVNLLKRKLRNGDILAQTSWRWRSQAFVLGDRQEIQLSKSVYFAHDSSQDFTPFSECCQHTWKKTWHFGTLWYLEHPQNIRIQIISKYGDYRVNLHSRRSSVPCSALDRALTRNVRDELLFRSWQIHVDQWLLKRKCHWRGQFSAVSSRSCQWLCWEN